MSKGHQAPDALASRAIHVARREGEAAGRAQGATMIERALYASEDLGELLSRLHGWVLMPTRETQEPT